MTIAIQRAAASSTTRKFTSTQVCRDWQSSQATLHPHGSQPASSRLTPGSGIWHSVLTRLRAPTAQNLAPIYRQTLDLRAKAAASTLSPAAKANLLFELDLKIDQFQTALKTLLGLDLVAFTTHTTKLEPESLRAVAPTKPALSIPRRRNQRPRPHRARRPEAHLEKTWLASSTGSPWQQGEAVSTLQTDTSADAVYKLKVPADAQPTEPYFTRPNTEQPYYDLTNPAYAAAPSPLAPRRMGRVQL